jgi:hypothetical protein
MWHKFQIVRARINHLNGYINQGNLYRIQNIRKSTCDCIGEEFLFEMDGTLEPQIFTCNFCEFPQSINPVTEIWFNERAFENRKSKNNKNSKNKLQAKKTKIDIQLSCFNIEKIKIGITIGELKQLTLLRNADFNNVIDRVGYSNNDFQINEREAARLVRYYRDNYEVILKNKNSSKIGEVSSSNGRKPYISIPSGGKNR